MEVNSTQLEVVEHRRTKDNNVNKLINLLSKYHIYLNNTTLVKMRRKNKISTT